jgi:hypothetical protein
VSVLLDAIVATQMVMTLFWQRKYPSMLVGVPQPMRGQLLTLVNLLVAAGVVALAVLACRGAEWQVSPTAF